MYRIIKTISIAVLLLVPIIMIAVNLVLGITIKDLLIGIIVYAFYSVIVAVYLLRFALIFIGVFAGYKLLQERHNKQLAV